MIDRDAAERWSHAKMIKSSKAYNTASKGREKEGREHLIS